MKVKKVDWLLQKKNSLFHSLWVIFSVETALYNDTTGHVEQEKAKGCLLVYLSSHVDK